MSSSQTLEGRYVDEGACSLLLHKEILEPVRKNRPTSPPNGGDGFFPSPIPAQVSRLAQIPWSSSPTPIHSGSSTE